MKVLFIGGTGNISVSVSKLAVARGIELTLLNRGQQGVSIDGAETIVADISQPEQVRAALGNRHFDAVVNWIAFVEPQIERDLDLFRGRCGQYIFISSASAYQKPLTTSAITESTPLANPYWQYSRDKIRCEERLMRAYRDEGFPMTIVRPSHTYDKYVPVAVGNWASYLIPQRMLDGKPIVVHGDGTSLWTLTHSEDFAKGFVGLLGHPQAIGHAFQITSDFVLTWDQIYSQIGDALGVKPNIVHIPSEVIARVDPGTGAGLLGDKMWCAVFDNSKIKQFVPDYVATIPFHLGIRRTLAWFQADERRMQVSAEDHDQMERILAAAGG
ncbi:MAG TPA: SDR family oxidoreductase [Aggregatilinea sp.]|uniref:SDR family oxidoreductase n=1 Tax=Aggregatilinea sp. TaxID=2806333 RepID=UPI002C2B45C6|nr:SDR family oxidoreductase [Aggregatilinea sp.]HML21358.1 SDR family oxidoreductase [Aggregatilinea sp.]